MTDISDSDLRLAEMLKARHRAGDKPVTLCVPVMDVERVRAHLLWLLIPEAAFIIVADTEPAVMEFHAPPTINALAALAGSFVAGVGDEFGDSWRAREVNAAADLALARYRHNDPDVAARYRAERQTKRAKGRA